jgi:peptidoglycan/xylan/chitin deacetylase (PgdA/CDA1 family)
MSLAAALRTLCAEALWRMPGRFPLVRLLGASYSGRSVLFHHVSDRTSPFTEGLGVRIPPADFEAVLSFLSKHYRFLDLDDWLRALAAPAGPKPPLLLTFDDAYASVARVAAPVCRDQGIPALFFVNAAMIDNAALAFDNLACYVVNTQGMGILERVAKRRFRALRAFFTEFLPTLSGAERERLGDEIAGMAGVDRRRLAAEADLYLGREDLRALPTMGFEIGNHTLSHVHLRSLTDEELLREIEGNRRRLEKLTGANVRAFSFPYGAFRDATPAARETVEAGHSVAFMVGAGTNTAKTAPLAYQRVSLKDTRDAVAFTQLELMPRLRALRDRTRDAA